MNKQDELTTLTALEAALEIIARMRSADKIDISEWRKMKFDIQHLKEYAEFERSQLNEEAKP